MKIKLELNIPGDGRKFLNFWNWFNGDDVIAELKDGKIVLHDGDNEREITFEEYITLIEERVKLWK